MRLCVLWQALDINDQFVKAWEHLGTVGGGVVGGEQYLPVACYQKVLRIGWHGEYRGSQRHGRGGGRRGAMQEALARAGARAKEGVRFE